MVYESSWTLLKTISQIRKNYSVWLLNSLFSDMDPDGLCSLRKEDFFNTREISNTILPIFGITSLSV